MKIKLFAILSFLFFVVFLGAGCSQKPAPVEPTADLTPPDTCERVVVWEGHESVDLDPTPPKSEVEWTRKIYFHVGFNELEVLVKLDAWQTESAILSVHDATDSTLVAAVTLPDPPDLNGTRWVVVNFKTHIQSGEYRLKLTAQSEESYAYNAIALRFCD